MTRTLQRTLPLALALSLMAGTALAAMDAMDTMKKDDGMMKKGDGMMQDTMATELRSGALAGIEGHTARGLATLKGDALQLTGITVDKVPDGHVILAKDGDYKNGLDLGILRQFQGDVTFALPAGTDPAAYNTVVIWCEKFDVGIGQATLQ